MGDYYNKTRGPLSMTLNDGTASSVPPKTWYYISPANEGSASVQKLVAKGFLVRAKVDITVAASAPSVAAVPAVSEVPVAGPLDVSTPPAAPVSTPKVDRYNKSR